MAMPDLGNTVASLYTDQRGKYTAFATESFLYQVQGLWMRVKVSKQKELIAP